MKALRHFLQGGRISGLCALLAIATAATSARAQDDNPRPNRQDRGDRQGGQGGQGGPGGPGGPGGGGRNFDPAQMQQRMMERIREELGFSDETEWKAVQPLVQKVFENRVTGGGGGFGRLMGPGRSRNGDQNGGGRRGGGMFGQTSPEAEALQKAIDDNAPAAQIKDALAKYKSAQKAKQDKLQAAQDDLRKILTVKQEAAATLLGLLN